jgi:hypothetical protein
VNQKKKQNQNSTEEKYSILYSVFDFDFDFDHLSKPFRQCRYHGLSVPACLSVFCEFWHSMITALVKWVPCAFYRGVAVVAAFLVTFLAAEKSDSPAGRDPQCLSKHKTYIGNHMRHNKNITYRKY